MTPVWTDFASFVAHVRESCSRLHAPQPALRVLELEYPARVAALARARAHNEVMEAREQRETRGRLKVAR